MQNRSWLTICLLVAGCYSSKGEDPVCFADTWAGSSAYKFNKQNFGCDSSPIEGDFLLDETSLLVPTGMVTSNGIRAAFVLALDNWNIVSSNLEIRYNNGTVSPGVRSADNVHHVFMTAGYDSLVPGTFASTWLNTVTSNPNAASDCDVELFTQQLDDRGNQINNPWTEVEPPALSTEMSFAAIIRHEMGHCVGLLENNISGSVMSYSSLGIGLAMPSLNVDDEDAVIRIYGL